MAAIPMLVEAPPDAVWRVWADGWCYDQWVVGANGITDVDGDWPAVGSSLGYRIGPRFAAYTGRTTVRICEPGHRLELEAHAWPAGSARIALRVEAWGQHSLVTLDEHPIRGLGARVHNTLTDLAMRPRHARTLRNLARLVVARHRAGA